MEVLVVVGDHHGVAESPAQDVTHIHQGSQLITLRQKTICGQFNDLATIVEPGHFGTSHFIIGTTAMG